MKKELKETVEALKAERLDHTKAVVAASRLDNVAEILKSPEKIDLAIDALADKAAQELQTYVRSQVDIDVTAERMKTYTHAQFIEEGPPLLMRFLTKLITRSTELMKTGKESTETATALEERKKRHERSLAQMLASACTATSDQFRWMWAVARGLVQKSRVTDPFLLDIDSKTVPGAYSRSGLYSKMTAWFEGATAQYPCVWDVLLSMDNIGRYRAGTSRIGTQHIIPVVTNGLANFLWRRDMPEQLQKKEELGPKFYKDWNTVTTDVMKVETTPREEETFSEDDLFNDEVYGYLEDEFKAMNARFEHRGEGAAAKYVDLVIEDQEINPERDPRKKKPRVGIEKTCPLCNATVVTFKQKCPRCLERLPTKAQMSALAPPQLAVFSSSAPRRFKKTGEEGQVRDEPDDQKVMTMQLPVVEVNPNRAANIKFALSKYFNYMRLRGYCPEGVDCEREWLYLSTDEGAKLNDAIADPNIVHLLGAGHEEQAYIQRLCRMAYGLGGDFLLKVLGFSDKAGEVIFKKAKHPHKPYQILMLYMRSVVTRSFMREYFHEKGIEKTSEETVDNFVGWLKRHPRKILANFFVLRELPALACVRSGVRRYKRGGDCGEKVHVRTFSAGRKILNPVMWSRNATRYAPALVKETATINARMKPEVRNQLEHFFSNQGQGWDWKMENANRLLKRTLSGANTLRTWLIGAASLDLVEACRGVLARVAGIKDLDREVNVRTLPDLEPLIIAAEKLIWADRMLKPDGDSDEVQPRGILPDSNLAETAFTYYDQGKELQAKCIRELQETPAGQLYATTKTRAKLVPFAAEEEDEAYASDGDEEDEGDEEGEGDDNELGEEEEGEEDNNDEAMEMFGDGDGDEEDAD